MSEKSAAQLIEILLAKLKCSDSNPQFSLVQNWVEIVGADVASHSKLTDIKGKVLVITVDHPAWSTIITMKKHTIVEKISLLYPDLGITRVQVRVGGDT